MMYLGDNVLTCYRNLGRDMLIKLLYTCIYYSYKVGWYQMFQQQKTQPCTNKAIMQTITEHKPVLKYCESVYLANFYYGNKFSPKSLICIDVNLVFKVFEKVLQTQRSVEQ